MKNIIRFFIHRSFVVNLISAFVILAGVLLGSMIKRDLIPPFKYKIITVTASLPGASATEIEKFLTYPIENALQGLPHAKETNSRAEQGTLILSVFFDAGYDNNEMDDSVEQIQSRINQIRWKLPQQARDIIVKQRKVDTVFHMGIALENFVETNLEHRKIAKNISDSIASIPGIVSSNLAMNDQNIYVFLNQELLAKHEVSIAEIRTKIQQSLSFSPIGQVEFNEKSFSIEVERPAEALEALNNLAIRGNRSGDILHLNQLAQVKLQIDEIKNTDRFNGNPSLRIYVSKDTASDSILLKKEVNKVLDKYNKSLPKPLRIVPFLDGPHFIESQLRTLTGNGIFGFCIVLLILTLFFNFRVSLVTSFGIPIAYCGTLVTLYLLDISIDIISVVGMILVLGILVDDAIIIAERYMENLEKGLKPKMAAFEASRDLMIPVTGTVLTTIFAFTPMILIDSEVAIVFYAIPIVIITSLAMSWLESFFILPNHLQHFIKTAPQKDKTQNLFARTKKRYRILLANILKFRYFAVLGLIVFMGASIWIAQNKIQQNFMFSPDIERISVRVTLKESKSLAQTEKMIAPIEQYLLRLPKDTFEGVTTRVGSLWTHGREYTGFRYAKINAYINKDLSHPKAIKKKYTKLIQEGIKEFKTDEFEVLSAGVENRGMDEVKKDMVTIKVTGHEDVDFLELQQSITQSIKGDENINLSLITDKQTFDEKWVFEPDSERLAQHQLTQDELTQQLRSFFVPHELMQIRMGGETKWLYTQVQREKVFTKKELSDISILNRRGLTVPLEHLGIWTKKKQLSTIRHFNNKRLFTFDLAFDPEKDMNVVKAKTQAQTIAGLLESKYPTYNINVEDADKGETERRAWAGRVALLCVILVLFTLSLVLGSVSLPLIVGLPIPFGLMGIVWALYLHNMPMGMMSLIGLIGTVGVSVNDSLIMVDQINKRARRRGFMKRIDIIDGASSRLRAIILTTVTTLGGVIPMAYGIGGESGFTQPLAFSIGWGLFFSTFLTLFALPAFIEIRRDIGALLMKWAGKAHTKLNQYEFKELAQMFPTPMPEIKEEKQKPKEQSAKVEDPSAQPQDDGASSQDDRTSSRDDGAGEAQGDVRLSEHSEESKGPSGRPQDDRASLQDNKASSRDDRISP